MVVIVYLKSQFSHDPLLYECICVSFLIFDIGLLKHAGKNNLTPNSNQTKKDQKFKFVFVIS